MCVDARRLGRAAAVLVCAVFVAATASCGGGQPRQQAPAEAASNAPKVLSPAERADWYQACWAHFSDKAWDQFKACYADNVESEHVDSGQPVVRNADDIIAGAKATAGSFPDIKGTNQLILVKGNTLAGITLITGTNTSTIAIPGSQPVPATGKPIGMLEAHLIQLDGTGSKVVKEESYMDSGTMMAQLSLSPSAARPVMANALAAPKVVIAAGTPAELSNVELVRARMAAYNSHDAKGVAAFNAPDFVYHDMTAPADLPAPESLAAMTESFKAFPDSKLVPLSIWGAGDYVVVAGRFEGTNKAASPAMGLKKATNKVVSARYLSICRWESGKLKDEWLFGDGTAMARQLGLMKPQPEVRGKK